MDDFLDRVRAARNDPAAVLALTLERFSAQAGTLHRLADDGLLHLESYAGPMPPPVLQMIERIPVGKGIAGLTVERNEPVDICNIQTDQSGQARPGAKTIGMQGSLCVPVRQAGQAVGALGIATAEERQFTAEETDLLIKVGEILAE